MWKKQATFDSFLQCSQTEMNRIILHSFTSTYVLAVSDKGKVKLLVQSIWFEGRRWCADEAASGCGMCMTMHWSKIGQCSCGQLSSYKNYSVVGFGRLIWSILVMYSVWGVMASFEWEMRLVELRHASPTPAAVMWKMGIQSRMKGAHSCTAFLVVSFVLFLLQLCPCKQSTASGA